MGNNDLASSNNVNVITIDLSTDNEEAKYENVQSTSSNEYKVLNKDDPTIEINSIAITQLTKTD